MSEPLALVYRCPQCGATYPAPGDCSNQHPPAALVTVHEAAPTAPAAATSSSTAAASAPDVASIVAAVKVQLDTLATGLRSAIADAVGAIQKDAAANVAELKAELDRTLAAAPAADAPPPADTPAATSATAAVQTAPATGAGDTPTPPTTGDAQGGAS